MKSEIRVVGIDDSPFEKGDRTVLVIGAFFRGGAWMDGVLSTRAEVDGEDATYNLIYMINTSKFKPLIQCILLDGIAVGGFNVINIHSLEKHTGIPVIVVVRHMPDFQGLEETLRKLGMEQKYELMVKAGTSKPVNTKYGKCYIQVAGISMDRAEEIMKICCTRSYIPEAIRVAHLIGAGVVKGESRGRA